MFSRVFSRVFLTSSVVFLGCFFYLGPYLRILKGLWGFVFFRLLEGNSIFCVVLLAYGRFLWILRLWSIWFLRFGFFRLVSFSK